MMIQSAKRKKTTSKTVSVGLPPEYQKIMEARHHDPFSILGIHPKGTGNIIRAYIPCAKQVWVMSKKHAMQRVLDSDFFEWQTTDNAIVKHPPIIWVDSFGHNQEAIDPYSFAPQIPDFDLHLFQQGKHWHMYRVLGAHIRSIDGIDGVFFAVWAPNAVRVSVVSDFNAWDGRRHTLRNRGNSGIWEIFIPGLQKNCIYKYEIRDAQGVVHLKADPFAQANELRPKTASVVADPEPYIWHDQAWQKNHRSRDWLHHPLSIYEVHLGSWRRNEKGDFLTYRDIAQQLVEYVKFMGYTHIQLLPISEHPLDASWGYQTTGYFSPTSRFGTPHDFRYFVDLCHQHEIGIILDWVPAHFPKDQHALASFDGSALFEHDDPRKGEHRDWGTLIYNYGRNEVRNFLLCSAIFWLEEFHLDGLRVDAVASMIYLDYSREDGDWVANQYGGNENLEALDFIRDLNRVIHGQFPGCLVIAEESTAWPQVTRPTYLGGLGFSMKWNMGWMHDTLEYMKKDPIHRHFHHNQLTLGLLYAFTENFVLPLSHDEVVHGKGSLINRMPGDEWQKFANLRLLYSYLYTYPGKKISFMGNEFGQGTEWNFDSQLDWYVLDYPLHRGVQKLTRDLNKLYTSSKALYYHDFEHEGFEWIDCHDAQQSVIVYLRKHANDYFITAINFTPVPRHDYTIGVPKPGCYQEVLNSDSHHYGGSNIGNPGNINSRSIACMNRPYSVQLTLPPLAAIVIKLT